jgi:GNAT superfamily N-acetyltransferase
MTITEAYTPGCIGRIAQLHAQYYAASNGFGVAFEAMVARELGEFCAAYTPGRDGLWLAQDSAGIQGSVAIDGSHAGGAGVAAGGVDSVEGLENAGAHLRWFITSDALRGQGVGRQLLSRALAFADACGYRRTYLWTFNGLLAARHLYESHGFALVHESAGDRWGSVVIEQKFVREV